MNPIFLDWGVCKKTIPLRTHDMSHMMDINVGGQLWQVHDVCDRDEVVQGGERERKLGDKACQALIN